MMSGEEAGFICKNDSDHVNTLGVWSAEIQILQYVVQN